MLKDHHQVVGEELMRDSALKQFRIRDNGSSQFGRRRAHARQRFETSRSFARMSDSSAVGEELMRDSALKPTV